MKKIRYKILLFIIIGITSLVGISKISATCYEIKDANSHVVIHYTTDNNEENGKYQDTRYYKITVVNDSFCNIKNGEQIDSGVKNYDEGNIVSCGDKLLTDIPSMLPKIIHTIYIVLQILVPILLVIFGSLDFFKAVIASKEDEIKKGQQTFIKRLISGIIVFFVFAIVRLVISFAGDEDSKSNIMKCASCIINNDENCVGG